jgi:UDP-N-acetylglucosamine--N-acetylmuramyl-(pentapeptide) pyrophosphoryl-undecaprenol N-acetylglucosamine transferase
VSHVLFTGGGTAGHVVPTFPVIAALAERGVRISFVGSTSGLEADLLEGVDADFYGIAAGKLRRYLSAENLRDVFRVLLGAWQAFRLLGRLRPDVVFSKGGFVSFPVVFAAWLRRVPVIAHESDLTPGLANRLALPFVRTVCTSFRATAFPGFKGRVVHTGTPVREALLAGQRSRGRQFLGAGPDERVLLVTGGSLGADIINQVVREALDELLANWRVVHVCGPGKLTGASDPGYLQFEYVTDAWGDMLAAADLVVSRAGANTLYELLALGKPNLLIPLSRRASRGDQLENAEFAKAHGFSRVLLEEDLDARSLLREVDALYGEREAAAARLQGFAPPDAVGLICAELAPFLDGSLSGA